MPTDKQIQTIARHFLLCAVLAEPGRGVFPG
jgi:hypothetical protein